MIQNILIVDVETSGLSAQKNQIIEIGAILYNIKKKGVLQAVSTLLPCEENPVESINKISPGLTQESYPKEPAMNLIFSMLDQSDICVAHNVRFDKEFLEHNFPEFIGKKWVCTKDDFCWPVALSRKRLEDVCGAMGVPYLHAHRALTDCNFLAQCFSKVEDLSARFNEDEF